MRTRYNELYDEYRKLRSKYDYIERQNENLREENKKQEKIIKITKQIKCLYEEKIKKFENENDNCQQKNKKLEEMNDILIGRILNFQKILEEKYSDWHIVADNAWRYINGRMISYTIPDPFIKGWESKVKFDSYFEMIEFLYPDGNGRLLKYKIPIELYHLLGGNIFCKVSDRYTPYIQPLYEDEEDVKRILISKGVSLKGKYTDVFLIFVLNHQSVTYTMKEFGVFCGFVNRETRRQYHDKLKKAGMIREVAKDVYEFIRVKT